MLYAVGQLRAGHIGGWRAKGLEREENRIKGIK